MVFSAPEVLFSSCLGIQSLFIMYMLFFRFFNIFILKSYFKNLCILLHWCYFGSNFFFTNFPLCIHHIFLILVGLLIFNWLIDIVKVTLLNAHILLSSFNGNLFWQAVILVNQLDHFMVLNQIWLGGV